MWNSFLPVRGNGQMKDGQWGEEWTMRWPWKASVVFCWRTPLRMMLTSSSCPLRRGSLSPLAQLAKRSNNKDDQQTLLIYFYHNSSSDTAAIQERHSAERTEMTSCTLNISHRVTRSTSKHWETIENKPSQLKWTMAIVIKIAVIILLASGC